MLRSSPWDSVWLPWVERKWTWESPLYPSFRVHVDPAFEAQGQLPLPRFDVHPGAQGLVLEPPRHVHDDLAARQPPLAAAVDVGVGDLSEAEIAADVDMPGAQVGVDLVVVSVGLVGNAFGGAEVDAAGDRFAAVVVEDGNVNPVAPAVEKLDPHARGFHHLLLLHVAPPDLTHLLLALLHRHRCRRNGGYFDVGGARLWILRLAPAGEIIADELVRRRCGQWMDVGRRPPVHFHAEIERFLRVLGAGEDQARFALPVLHEGMLVEVGKGKAGDDEARTGGDDLQGLDRTVRMGVLPGPQVIAPAFPRATSICRLPISSHLPSSLGSNWSFWSGRARNGDPPSDRCAISKRSRMGTRISSPPESLNT